MITIDSSLLPLTRDAFEIWRAGVAAVDSEQLVARNVSCDRDSLIIAGQSWSLQSDSRICVVGGGKAGAGMVTGLEQSLSPELLEQTEGWVNIPEGCERPTQKVHLHPARPAGVNEPTTAGVAGSQRILEMVQSLRTQDLCIVLISGGGSALLPAPVSGLTLEEKLQATRILMRQGATIDELNCVRRNLSAIKGGGLLHACRAGLLVTMIISDVIGDPLHTIASGPTILCEPDREQALAILHHYSRAGTITFPPAIFQVLQRTADLVAKPDSLPCVVNLVIGNNHTAVEASAQKAVELGYKIADKTWDQPGHCASAGREFGRQLAALADTQSVQPLCIVSGGETTVKLAATNGPQRGGRNQEFALAALTEWLPDQNLNAVLVSGGTDGEDGPTDAAGAYVDRQLLERVRTEQIDPEPYLAANNSYSFFEKVDGLLKTGPTHTNVMDLRVGLIAASSSQPSESHAVSEFKAEGTMT